MCHQIRGQHFWGIRVLQIFVNGKNLMHLSLNTKFKINKRLELVKKKVIGRINGMNTENIEDL